MPDPTRPTDLSLRPVFELLESLVEQHDTTAADSAPAQLDLSRPKDEKPTSLGDLSRIWDFLGYDHPPPGPQKPVFEASIANVGALDAYASDGGLYYPASSKNVRWRDEEDDEAELADTQDAQLTDEALTKNQRKKRNRKARKAAEKLESATETRHAHSGDETKTPPAKVAGNHHPMITRSKEKSANTGRVQTPATPQAVTTDESDFGYSTPTRKAPTLSFLPAQVIPPKAKSTTPKSKPAPISETKLKANAASTPLSIAASPPKAQSTQKFQWPTAKPYVEKSSSVIPGFPSFDLPDRSRSSRPEIKQVKYKDAKSRNWSLLLKLTKEFPDDVESLVSPLQMSVNMSTPHGIHVFIDASNIFIGFLDYLKRARGYHEDTHVRRVYPSFHSLALLLERRRPIAKRVLVGSTPWTVNFDEAQEIGYETCILEKVFKAKELTPRQRKFAQRDSNRKTRMSSGYDTSDGPPELPEPQPKLTEQGVDEILHLKILESLVDGPDVDVGAVEAPRHRTKTGADAGPARPTMVLATGDAAEAEFSAGFLRYVKSALKKGWFVEVAAWSKSISYEYIALQKKHRATGSFKIIMLDQYAEELLPSTSEE